MLDWVIDNIIGILALIVAVFSLFYTIYVNKRQNGADIRFQFNKNGKSDICEFIIENKGNQDAENFSFLINEKDPVKYNHKLSSLRQMDIIKAKAKHSKEIQWSGQGYRHIIVKASYEDEKGPHKIEQKLHF